MKIGVPKEIITSILGVETRYGKIMGSYRVLDALTTLSFDFPRRSKFFKDELIKYFLLTRENNLDILTVKGSYAGAMGYGQFISSSYRAYAIDFDGDGIPDGGDLYAAADQVELSLARSLIGTPGEQVYDYSNSDVMLAGELLNQATGQSPGEYWTYGIANRIGINSEWWTDEANNVLSYCCLDATPRDFARFGLLYARQGLWLDEQVISADWINHSTQPARFGNYGYYWWPAVNGGYAALGVMGQLIGVYPEHDLVVLRFSRYVRRGDGSTLRSGGN